MTRENSSSQLPCQVAVGGDEPLANRVLGDRWIFFATQVQQRERTEDEGCATLTKVLSLLPFCLLDARSPL